MNTSFLKLGRVADYHGNEMVIIGLLGRKVGIRADLSGRLEAVELQCRHQRADLSRAPCRDGIVTCPMHGWRYDLRSGDCLDHPDLPLRRFELRVEGQNLFISATPTSPLETTSSNDMPQP